MDIQTPTTIIDSIFGPLVAFKDDFATRQIAEYGAHTRNEVALLRSFVDAGDLVYDVGAHIGCFSIPLSDAAGPGGRVIAIEAEPDNFSLLWQNLHRRGLIGRVVPVHGIAGGEQSPYSSKRTELHTSATYFVPDPGGHAAVTFALDDVHTCFAGGHRSAVVKIDVEGMELSVLHSAEQMIVRDRPVLYVEVVADQMARFGRSAVDVETFLRPHDYRFFRNIGDRNSTNDTFILAELRTVEEGGAFFDLLAVPSGSTKLPRAEAMIAAAKT